MIRTIQQATDSGIHRVVNKRLRDLGRGGYGTVDRALHARLITGLMDEGEISASDIQGMVDEAVREAVEEYVRNLHSEQHWLLYELGQLNRKIDSHALYVLLTEGTSRLDAINQAINAVLDTPDSDRLNPLNEGDNQ